MVCESRLELARIMLADFDPAVAGLAAQPFLLAADAVTLRGRACHWLRPPGKGRRGAARDSQFAGPLHGLHGR